MRKFSVIKKKETYALTWLGKLIILILILSAFLIFIKKIHPFLSPNEPENSKVLIMEGFLPDFAIRETMKIFNDGNYELLIITGKKMDKGALLFPYENDGEYSAAIFRHLGFDSLKIKVVGLENNIRKDRTWASALAVKTCMDQSRLSPDRINLVSLGCHSRRSRYLFEKAFGNDVKFGIISLENIGYDPSAWWKTSFGFKDVLEETLAWIYVRFFFYPDH